MDLDKLAMDIILQFGLPRNADDRMELASRITKSFKAQIVKAIPEKRRASDDDVNPVYWTKVGYNQAIDDIRRGLGIDNG